MKALMQELKESALKAIPDADSLETGNGSACKPAQGRA